MTSHTTEGGDVMDERGRITRVRCDSCHKLTRVNRDDVIEDCSDGFAALVQCRHCKHPIVTVAGTPRFVKMHMAMAEWAFGGFEGHRHEGETLQ